MPKAVQVSLQMGEKNDLHIFKNWKSALKKLKGRPKAMQDFL